MATHSSVLAWRIPGTGSLMDCHLWGRTESDTTEATQQQQQQLTARRPLLSAPLQNLVLQYSCLENPRDGEPGGLPSMGSQSRTRLK